jgi:hydroxyacylglutathione hydrolase
MFFRQYELGCLSIFSYMIGDESSGRAIVVDPQRDVEAYISDAAEAGLSIERVIETHFHADFLSGHLELAAATGAVVSYGPGAEADFPIETLADGQRLELGEVSLEVRATPGHTPESISLVVYEQAGDEVPYGVLTGDALFIGDVGRPDLAVAGADASPETLARQLYRSLWDKLLTLPEETKVFPAHGAGSSCGKSLSDAKSSTIGSERALNAALRAESEEAFVASVTAGQPAPPRYFPYAAAANRRQRPVLDEKEEPRALGLEELLAAKEAGATVLDVRPPEAFAKGHLPQSLNVGLDGRFAEYAGDVLEVGAPIVLIADPGRALEARVRLARVGFDSVIGALEAPAAILSSRPELFTKAERLDPDQLSKRLCESLQLVDVRNPAEQEAGMIKGALSIPLARLADDFENLDASRATVVYCAGGHRSSVAASLLRLKGFSQVSDLRGGFDAWAAAGGEMEPK